MNLDVSIVLGEGVMGSGVLSSFSSVSARGKDVRKEKVAATLG